MPRQRVGLVGRHDELDALRPIARTGFGLVRGPAGSGRSALLAGLARDLAATGTTVLVVGAGRGARTWDRFGVGPLLDAVRDGFERLDTDPALPASVAAVDRLATPDTYATTAGRAGLLTELARMFARIGTTAPVTVLLDDVDAVGMPAFAVTSARRAGHGVVATAAPVGSGARSGLAVLADRVVDLHPLPDTEVARLLQPVVNARVGPAVLDALRAALGPLYGNPGTMLTTVTGLRRHGRLVVVQGHLHLRDARAPIALPADHPLLAALGGDGGPGRDLVVLVAGPATVGIDDVPVLAAATGHPPDRVGREVDRLVRAGALAVDAGGRLDVPCRALAAAVEEQGGAVRARLLHRRVAERRLAAGPGVHGVAVTADHIAAAGVAYPASPELAGTLHDLAVRAAGPSPDRAVHRFLAAWRHAGAGRARDRARTELIRLLVCTGRYDDLARFVDEAVAADRSGTGAGDLAWAAALAALHRGRPVSGDVLAACAAPPGAPDPLRCSDRWFRGGAPSVDEVVECFGRLPGRGPVRPLGPGADVAPALRARHLVPVFTWLLGADYRPPADGPQAAYDRVVGGYAAGEWHDALGAARELAVTAGADGLTRQRAALLAAEMCVWRGDERAALAWLREVPQDTPFGTLRAWVECGSAHQAGDVTGALRAGWRGWVDANPDDGDPDRGWLLLRLATLAGSGPPRPGRRGAAWPAGLLRLGALRGASTLVDGLVVGNDWQVLAGVDLVRRRRHRPDLAWACLAGSTAVADPEPLLREAHDIAQEIGAARLRVTVRRAMAARAVRVPVVRTRDDGLSAVELQVVALIRQGLTNRQIAARTRLSEKTVENHLTRLFLKTGYGTRHGLAVASLEGRVELRGA